MGHDPEFTSELEAASQDGFPAEALFASSRTAVILIDGVTDRIVAANPAALALLAIRQNELHGLHWRVAFAPSCEQAMRTALAQAVTARTPVAVTMTGRNGDAPLVATVSGFNSAAHPYVVLRLDRAGQRIAAPATSGSTVLEQLGSLPDAFVLADRELRIEYWNTAFSDLAGHPPPQEIEGQSLLRWLNLTTPELDQMRSQEEQREAALHLTTTLSVGRAFALSVEVTAVCVPDATHAHWGFILRKVDTQAAPPDLTRS
jgi:PAS domain-containing protein